MSIFFHLLCFGFNSFGYCKFNCVFGESSSSLMRTKHTSCRQNVMHEKWEQSDLISFNIRIMVKIDAITPTP